MLIYAALLIPIITALVLYLKFKHETVWWDNRLSFNLNHNNEYRGIRDLLKGYAFDGKHHEFLTQIN